MSIKRAIALLIGACLLVCMFAGCSGKQYTSSNPDAPLVYATATLNAKFSPFFATVAYDQDVADFVSVAALTTDRQGAVIYNAIKGETTKYNGKNYKYTGITDVSVKRDEAADTTTYTIKLRDDVKFSDGTLLTADDLIFTYYVLADKTYDGSSTLYSYNILGMTNYRENNSLADTVDVKKEMENLTDEDYAWIAENIVVPVLTDELDWVKSIYGDERYASYTEKFPVAKDLLYFFYGLDENYDSTTEASEDKVLQKLFDEYGSDYVALGAAYGADFTPDIEPYILERTLANMDGTEVPNIEGIKKISATEVQVTTKGFQAPAIYSICGNNIAPMHYYGDKNLYNYENNQFGFPREDLTIVREKTNAPMGAGPYKFVKYENKIVYFEANEYYYKGVPKTKYVQFKETLDADMINAVVTDAAHVANPSGSKTKFEAIKTENSNSQLIGDVITTNSVDNLGYGYIGINAETVNVGGNPGSTESKNMRKALATVFAVCREIAIDSYYGNAASVINYPISNTSWAAPQKSDQGYKEAFSRDINDSPIYESGDTYEQKQQKAAAAALGYLEAAGFTVSNGKVTAAPEGAKLSYEIIIPADGSGDHPAFGILTDARKIFEGIGISLEINDPTDSNVLWDRLDAGTQEMWTAAWGATIDPDMYQVYHSSNMVGKGGTDSNHYHIASDVLDDLIMKARVSDDQTYRKATYKTALDELIDWAVEIPTYQRQNIVIFSTKNIYIETLTPDITTYWGWMHDIENVVMK